MSAHSSTRLQQQQQVRRAQHQHKQCWRQHMRRLYGSAAVADTCNAGLLRVHLVLLVQ